MKPIRFITHRDTVWYNLNDYINFLLEARVIWPMKPELRKKQRQPKSPYQTVLDRLSKSQSVYQLHVDGEQYVDWVIFENFFRPLKPFLIQPSDWMNPDSLFRQLQLFIEHPKKWSLLPDRDAVASFFKEVEQK